MRRLPLILATAFFAVALAATGCNVLDAAYEEGGSIENLIEDARHARTAQRYDRAVELLEEAYERAPDNPTVRLELAVTLMQREGLSSMSLVAEVTDFVIYGMGSGSGARSGGRSSGTCSWESAEPFEPFDPSAFEAYREIREAIPVLRRVHALLAGPDGTVLPASLLGLSPCEAIVDGELLYDRDAAMAELVARFGGHRSLARTALQLNVVVLTLNAYTGIFEQPDLPVDWFVVGEPGDTRLGFCVEDEEAMDLLYERTDPAVGDLARALFSLDLLVYDAGSESLEALRDDALEMYVTFREDLSRLCD